MSTKWLTHRGDNSHFTATSGKSPPARCGGRVLERNLMQLEMGGQTFEQLTSCHHHFLKPGARGVQGHELNKTQTQRPFLSKYSQRFYLMIIQPADYHSVHFDR